MTIAPHSGDGAGTVIAEPRPPRLLHELFDLSWPQWPDVVAIDVPASGSSRQRVQCSYAQLARLSQGVAEQVVQAFGDAGHENLVALLMPRTSVLTYAAQLGVLRAGMAYVPLDPALPDGRIANILADAEPPLVLTDAHGARRLAQLGIADSRVIVLTDQPAPLSSPGPSTEARRPEPGTLAYVIYTSGTTGRPKGVMIEHRAIANLMASDLGEFGLAPGDRVAQLSSHGYDSSVEEIWLALASGATLVVLDDEVLRLGPDLISWLDHERVTVLCPSPTLLRSMGSRDMAGLLPRLRLLYVGGERMPLDVVANWSTGRRMVNGYGPTECAVVALRGDLFPDEPVTIGRAIPGVDAWILDADLAEVADGESGELCLGGIGLGRGYWRAPGLTARAFVDHPSLGRIYRTGDLAHRAPDGRVLCAGRADAQVKIRGHRVELEEIDAHLARCAGVSAAACALSTQTHLPLLIAAIVPLDPDAPPRTDALRAALRATLPAHMVPSRFRIVDALPVTTSGKLDRDAIGAIGTPASVETVSASGRHSHVLPQVHPSDAIESVIAARAATVFRTREPVSLDSHFFDDLGADSLAAAELTTLLRDDPAAAAITVRDVYEAPTVRALAKRLTSRIAAPTSRANTLHGSDAAGGNPLVVTVMQTAWLGVGLAVSAALSAIVAVEILPRLVEAMGLIPFLLVLPVLAVCAFPVYAIAVTAFAVLTKRRLIGRYTERREPAWSSFYLRHWLVLRSVRSIPWWLIEGTELQSIVLRALGARIGRGVHLHRGVDLLDGGWDLLTIGDDVTLNQEASLRLVDLEDGQVIVGPITLEDDVTIHVRAGIGPGSHVGRGACLTPLSALRAGGRIPAGQRWDGIPAHPAGLAPARPALTRDVGVLTPFQFGLRLILARLGVGLLIAAPFAALAIVLSLASGAEGTRLFAWLTAPTWTLSSAAVLIALVVVPLPLELMVSALLARGLRRVEAGVIGVWSSEYIRVQIKTSLVNSASRWLAGSLVWPVWLRASGMRIGRDAEISTILDVVPELLSVGGGSFLTDGIYPGGPRVDRGTVTLAPAELGARVFIGNNAVIPGGQRVPDDVLVGVCTVVDDRRMRSGSSWFGHPPFPLARRPAPEIDPSLHRVPSRAQYLTRVFWEALRLAVPLPPVLITILWYAALAQAAVLWSPAIVYGIVAPAVTLGALGSLCLLVLAIKWVLLGRVKPGQHGFWSSWCGRWDILYVAWEQLARPILSSLEGTLLLAWYLRAMGAHIGRRVVLSHDFAQLVDPDMLWIGDGATVCGTFQAHTFEGRLLKIDRVRIESEATVASGALLFFGMVVGWRTYVAPHSVVMKHERLPADRAFEGCPVREG